VAKEVSRAIDDKSQERETRFEKVRTIAITRGKKWKTMDRKEERQRQQGENVPCWKVWEGGEGILYTGARIGKKGKRG